MPATLHHLSKHLEEDPATNREVRMAADRTAPFPEVHIRRSKDDVSEWCDVRSCGCDDEPGAFSISWSWHETLHLDPGRRCSPLDVDLRYSSALGHRHHTADDIGVWHSALMRGGLGLADTPRADSSWRAI